MLAGGTTWNEHHHKKWESCQVQQPDYAWVETRQMHQKLKGWYRLKLQSSSSFTGHQQLSLLETSKGWQFQGLRSLASPPLQIEFQSAVYRFEREDFVFVRRMLILLPKYQLLFSKSFRFFVEYSGVMCLDLRENTRIKERSRLI